MNETRVVVIGAIRSGKPAPISGADGGQSVAAILACVESAKRRRFVRVTRI